MAGFNKKTWVDRVSEYPNRRTLVDTTTQQEQTVTVTRAEGTVSQPGDAFSAANMNDLEDRIAKAHEVFTGVLVAGNTSITFTDASIKTNGIYNYYTSILGVEPEEKQVSEGSITLIFSPQEENMDVGLKVEGYY